MDNSFDLPPLPEPVAKHVQHKRCYVGHVYTADQMRAYARAAVKAEREACAKLCDERAYLWEYIVEREQEARQLAELIRARKEQP